MLKGLYSAATGMSVGLRRTDVISNNLANASTPGFRRELLSAGAYLGLDLYRLERSTSWPGINLAGSNAVGALGTGVIPAEAGLDFRAGTYETTSNPWDLAIHGDGLFAVMVGNAVGYTRRGDFRLDPLGQIVNGDGAVLLGVDGNPLSVPGSGQATVTEDGTICVSQANGRTEVGRIMVVEFADPSVLERGPRGTLLPTDASGPPLPAATSIVKQGCLERSNASPVLEMAEMLAAFRAYEANQRTIQALDQALGKAVTDVGRPM